MKQEHIDAIHELALHDTTVNAMLRMKHRTDMDWEETLAQLVLHLAREKNELFNAAVEARSSAPPPILIDRSAAAEIGKGMP